MVPNDRHNYIPLVVIASVTCRYGSVSAVGIVYPVTCRYGSVSAVGIVYPVTCRYGSVSAVGMVPCDRHGYIPLVVIGLCHL